MPAQAKRQQIGDTGTTVTLGGLVRAALAEHGNDATLATEALVGRLQRAPDLLRAIINEVIAAAVSLRAHATVASERRAIVQVFDGPAAVAALAGGIKAALLDMPLAGGLRLRDADRAAVLASAERYGKLAADTGHKARFLTRLAELLPDGRKVGDVVTEQRACALWWEAA